jgi:hypothetical protein
MYVKMNKTMPSMSPQRPIVSRGGRVVMAGRGGGRGGGMGSLRGGRGPGRPAVMSRGGTMLGLPSTGRGGGLVQRSPQGSSVLPGMRSRGGSSNNMQLAASLAANGLGGGGVNSLNSGLVSRPRAAAGMLPSPRAMQLQV